MSITSPARAARLAHIAHAQAASGADLSDETIALQRQLRSHQHALKAIQSIQDKAVFKAQILPDYAGYIDGILVAGSLPAHDKLFPILTLWTIDSGDLNYGAAMAKILLQTPDIGIDIDGFQRTAAVAVFEEFALQLPNAKYLTAAELTDLQNLAAAKTDDGSHQIDMPDKVRAKFFKACGEWFAEQGDAPSALDSYRRALSYDERSGVKKQIAALEKELN